MVEPLELVPALTSDPLGATVSMDLDDFNAIALNLAGGHAADHDGPLGDPATFPPQESQRRFVSFVLTGKNPDTGEQTVIDLDCYRANNEMHEDTRLEIRGDFDSCLFASDNLPYAHPLMLLIWPPKYLVDHSLKQTYLMIGGPHGKPRRAPLCHIPNIPFATCASRHIVRLYLPRLYKHGEAFTYNEEWPQKLYDEITFPTILSLHRRGFNIDPHRFPTSFRAEQYRATRRSGRPVHSDFPLSPEVLEEFGRTLLRRFQRTRWGSDAFFFHQLRQTKGYGGFELDDHDAREETLRNVTQYFEVDNLRIDDCRPPTVDVGIEFGLPGHVTLIRTLTHSRIIHHFANPSRGNQEPVTMEKVERMMTGSYYTEDPVVLLTDASGFRCTQPRASKCDYLQGYHTEKNPTYLVDNGKHAKFLKPRDVLELYRKQGRSLELMERLCTIFEECAQKQDSFPARVEPRVLYEYAYDQSISQRFAKDVSYIIPNHTWWVDKLLRQRACKIALEWTLQADPNSISRPGVLMLIATLIYYSNSLCARPEEGSRQALIEHATLPHRNGEPLQRCGMFFIRKMDYLADGCPTIVDVRGTHDRLHQLFSFNSREDLKNFLYPAVSLISRPAHIIRARNQNPHNKSVSTRRIFLAEDTQPEFDIPEFRADLELPLIEDINGEPIDNLSLFVTNIWRQLFSDFGEKGWQSKDQERPYMQRTRDEKRNMVLFYSGFDLKRRFRCFRFRTGKYKEDWDKTFENIFPGPDHSFPLAMQGYKQMTYFAQYMEFHKKCMNLGVEGERLLETVRKELKRKVNGLAFMPYAISTRVFDTRKIKYQALITHPKGYTGACPLIAINPRFSMRMEDVYAETDTDEGDDQIRFRNLVELTEEEVEPESDSGDDAMFVDLHEL